jgi:hypothetical protein
MTATHDHAFLALRRRQDFRLRLLEDASPSDKGQAPAPTAKRAHADRRWPAKYPHQGHLSKHVNG